MANIKDHAPKTPALGKTSDVPYPLAQPFWKRIVASYEKRKKEETRDQGFKFLPKRDLAKVLGDKEISDTNLNSTWSRIKNGIQKVPPEWMQGLVKIFELTPQDLEKLKEVYVHPYVLDLETWNPVVGTFQWPPFCDQGGGSSFLVNATRRFFLLAGKNPEYISRPFGDLLSGVGVDLSLALAETIARTRKAYIFHTPFLMGINLVGLYNDERFEQARRLLTNDETGDRMTLRVVTVADEVGDEYVNFMKSSLDGNRGVIEQTELRNKRDEEKDEADTRITAAINAAISNEAFYCGDELSCLLKAREMAGQCGLLFPLGTPQVARSKAYSRLPIYKVGLFSVPYGQKLVIEFLQKALRVYLENELEETSQRYATLYNELKDNGLEALGELSKEAQGYLHRVHQNCGDDFYTGAIENDALADRWARRTLRLYPESTGLDLNLPWQPILTRARELVQPVPNQTRTPGERRVMAMYRELPPVITKPEDSHPSDFTIFESVLGPLRPHLELSRAKRYLRSQSHSQLGSDNPATVAIGFFAIPPRLFDWRFFRFPIELKFAGVILGQPKREELESCDAVLRIMHTGRAREVRGTVPILLLDHGAAHNLLRDHGVKADRFELIDDTKTENDRGLTFVEKAGGRVVMVVADELTCLDVVHAAPDGYSVQLRNHRLEGRPADDGGSSAGPYFSMAVRNTAPDWVRFFEQAVPLSLQTHRDSIAETHAELYSTLKNWTAERIGHLQLPAEAVEQRVASWCRSVLLLDRPGELAPEWTPILERARRLIDAALKRAQTAQE